MEKALEEVLNNCFNYDEIINYNIKENDNVTKVLINYYQDYVFLNYRETDKIKTLDLIIYEYVKNRDFYNFLQDKIKEGSLPLFDSLEKSYNEYQSDSIRKIDKSIWI